MRVQVNARNRGYQFDALPGEKLLYAGLRSGIDLPFECATGTCGTCKARAVAGRFHDGWPDAPGKKFVKPERSELLMCQCVAEDDLTLEVSQFVYAADAGACAPAACSGVLRDANLLTRDVMEFAIELEQPRDFDAGQFIAVAAPGVRGFRAYSMVNFERGARRLAFVAKRKPGGGFSEWLFGAGPDGARLALFGPLGKSTFYPGIDRDILCIAGGSGIAGMMSILQRAAQQRHFERYRGWLFLRAHARRRVLP